MTSMARPTSPVVIGGVDTHGQTHHAAVIDGVGRELGDREFPASPAGSGRRPPGSVIMAPLTQSVWRALATPVPRWPAICAGSGWPWWRSTGPTEGLAERMASLRPARRLRRGQSRLVRLGGGGAEAGQIAGSKGDLRAAAFNWPRPGSSATIKSRP